MPSGWGYAAIPGRRFSFRGSTLDLLSAARVRSHPRLSRLGPDICTPEFDAELALARIRAEDPARGLGDALLDQRSVAGIGNLWKVEACWLAEIDPWRPLTRIGDEEILAVLAEARRCMLDSTANGATGDSCGCTERPGGRARAAASECAFVARAMPRPTWWCPGCQR